MKTYRYSWPKQDGTLGSKETDSAEAMLRFISEGSKDRTLFVETKGVFTCIDVVAGGIERLSLAAIIRIFLDEIKASREQAA